MPSLWIYYCTQVIFFIKNIARRLLQETLPTLFANKKLFFSGKFPLIWKHLYDLNQFCYSTKKCLAEPQNREREKWSQEHAWRKKRQYKVTYFCNHFIVLDFDALHGFVPFVHFEKRGKHPWKSVTFSKVAGWRPKRYQVFFKSGNIRLASYNIAW